MHSVNLQAAVTNTKDFEATELKANHPQAINLVINKSSELDSKLKQFIAATTHLLVAASSNLSVPTNSNTAVELISKWNPKAEIDPTKLEIIDDTIFPFELEEPSATLLFSRITLEEKLITAMYTDMKVNGHAIKLILDSGSAGSIITQQLMDQLSRQVDHAASVRIITTDGVTKTPINKINNFSFEVNGIITPIKVLVMEATQY
ncbi:hypothetical protein G9A89_008585 [Geosiphon pyriformis]|nr:hypothetical protein G9A89_008585 [Geosiphon pyriformis]